MEATETVFWNIANYGLGIFLNVTTWLITIFALFHLFFILRDTNRSKIRENADSIRYLIDPDHENITLQELLILFYRASVFVKPY